MPGGSKKGGGLETVMYKKKQSPMYKMKGNPMQRNFKDWWKQSKLKKDLKIAGDIIKKDVKTIEGTLTKVGSKFKKDVEGLPGKLGIRKQSPKKHTSASHPTGVIAAHKGHKSIKKTLKNVQTKIKRDIVPK